jgi:hypothetical protein
MVPPVFLEPDAEVPKPRHAYDRYNAEEEYLNHPRGLALVDLARSLVQVSTARCSYKLWKKFRVHFGT